MVKLDTVQKRNTQISTSRENSGANLYTYEHNGLLCGKITYRKNLVNEIKSKCSCVLDAFDANSMNDEKFRMFSEQAELEGFTIYKLIKV